MVICQEANGLDDNFLGQYAGGTVGTIERLAIVVGTGNSFIDSTTSTLTFPLKQKNDPTGNVICKVYDSNYTSVLATSSNTIDSENDLTDEFQNKEFLFSSPLTITDGYYYALLGSGTNNWDDANGVEPQFSDQTTITGNTSSWYGSANGKNDKTKTMSWCIGGTVATSARLPPPPIVLGGL